MQRKKVNDAHIKYIHLGNNRLPQRAVPRANRIEKWRSSPRKFNEESSKLFGFPVYYPPGRDQVCHSSYNIIRCIDVDYDDASREDWTLEKKSNPH